MKKHKLVSLLVLVALALSACGGGAQSTPAATTAPAAEAPVVATPAPATEAPAVETAAETAPPAEGARTLTVMTHDSFAASEEVIAAFEKENNVKVQILQSGDAGTALNKAILSMDKPLADVFYGVDNTFLSRALKEGIFEAYTSPLLADIPAEFKLDPQNQALPVDYGDVCLNYDKASLTAMNVAAPTSLEDLLKPEYKDLVAVENPAASSPGLAFLLATIGHFGPDKYLDFWRELKANGLLIVNDWDTAYNKEFTRAGGTRPIIVSYGSSPAFEVLYAEKPTEDAPTGVVTGGESCFRQIEFVGILKGAANPDLAQKWVDFMLSPTFQEDVPLQMYVFPVNQNAKLDETFAKYLAKPEKTAQVSAEDITANREKWIQEWTEAILR